MRAGRLRQTRGLLGLAIGAMLLASHTGARADAWTDACQTVRRTLEGPLPAALTASPEALHDHFTRAEAIGFSGLAWVEQDGQVLLSEGYGFADWSSGRHVPPSVIFDIGSVSKQFTAAAILKLQEMGALSVHDSIGRFIPSAPSDKRDISLHQLLTHTAGFRQEEASAAYAATYDEALDILLASELQSAPGETYSYSNIGYALLGAVIQIASGEDYETFLRGHLWGPAGLVDTGWSATDPNRYAEGLAFRPAAPHPSARIGGQAPYSRRGPGSLYSTPQDLSRWIHALRGERILSAASVEALLTPHVREEAGGRSFAAYGWVVSVSTEGTCTIWHDGGSSLVFNVLRVYPEQGFITHEMTLNEPGPWTRPVVSSAPAVLFGRRPSSLPIPVPADRPASMIAGVWRTDAGDEIELKAADQILYAPAAASNVIRLLTGFDPLTTSDEERVASVIARLPAILDALERREYEPLFQVLRAGESREEEVGYWPRQWAQWQEGAGDYLGAELIATVREDDRLSTYVLLRFERSSAIANVLHHDGGGITIGSRISRGHAEDFAPAHYVLSPAGPQRYLVRNPVFDESVEVRVGDDDTLTLVAPRGRQILRRARD